MATRWKPKYCDCSILYDWDAANDVEINWQEEEVCDRHTGLTGEELGKTLQSESRLAEKVKQQSQTDHPELYIWADQNGAPIVAVENGELVNKTLADIPATEAEGLTLITKDGAFDVAYDETSTLVVNAPALSDIQKDTLVSKVTAEIIKTPVVKVQ